MKATSSITGPYDDIIVPKCASAKPEVDYEGELVIIIGKDCKDVSKEEAFNYIHGYCIGNDVSARRWQVRWLATLVIEWMTGWLGMEVYLFIGK